MGGIVARVRGVMGVVVASMLLGCSSPSREDVYVWVPDDELRALAESAAAEWRACGSRQVYVTAERRDGAVPILVVDPSDPALEGHPGITRHDGDRVALYVMLATVRTDQGAVAHEIGHVLLERRGPDEHFGRGVMNGVEVPPDAHVTAEDCAELRAEYE